MAEREYTVSNLSSTDDSGYSTFDTFGSMIVSGTNYFMFILYYFTTTVVAEKNEHLFFCYILVKSASNDFIQVVDIS